MSTPNIPQVLLCLIFDFAYDIPKNTDPLKDVEIQSCFQDSIPSCFLMANLPRPEWFTCQEPVYLCGPCMCNRNITHLCDSCLAKLECILVPSPFRKGNPYFPSSGLDKSFAKFSPAIETFIDHLSHNACRLNHVYKGCALRKVRKMTTASLYEWNEYYGTLLSRDFLTEPGNFFLNAYPWTKPFITEVCHQLQQARFLPFWSQKLI